MAAIRASRAIRSFQAADPAAQRIAPGRRHAGLIAQRHDAENWRIGQRGRLATAAQHHADTGPPRARLDYRIARFRRR
jgi:hypothetical protein